MIELAQILMLSVVVAGHVFLLFDPAPSMVQSRQGFAEFWVDGKFVKYIDLR